MKTAPDETASEQRMAKHLAAIARLRDPFENPGALAEVFGYVRAHLESLGLACEAHRFTSAAHKDAIENIERSRPLTHSGRTFENLLARREGARAGLAPYVVGAHLDAVPGSPGADDNASGAAVMLEIAELLKDGSPRHPVLFAGFNLEEYNMVGSQALAQTYAREKRLLAGMFSLEMVGYVSHRKGSQDMPIFLRPFYPDTGDFIALVGNTKSKRLLEAVRGRFAEIEGLAVEALTLPLNGAFLPEARLSDHSPFWDAGYPALLVTDTSFFRNPHYHSPEDTVSTLDLAFMAKVARAMARFLEDPGAA